jgi:hypothetical protein
LRKEEAEKLRSWEAEKKKKRRKREETNLACHLFVSMNKNWPVPFFRFLKKKGQARNFRKKFSQVVAEALKQETDE